MIPNHMTDSVEYARWAKRNGLQTSTQGYHEWKKSRDATVAASNVEGLTPEQQQRQNEVNLRNQELEQKMTLMQQPINQEQARIDRNRVERNKDLGEGRARGEEIFADGSLGNLSPELLANIRKQAGGFSDEEMNAMRDSNLATIRQGNQTARRQLKITQAQQGVRGAQAVAQQNKLINDQGAQLNASERDLFIKNIDARRAGQSALTDVEKFAIDLRNREKNARLATELGFGSLGAADRGSAVQAVIGQQQADAARNQGGGGGKK